MIGTPAPWLAACITSPVRRIHLLDPERLTAGRTRCGSAPARSVPDGWDDAPGCAACGEAVATDPIAPHRHRHVPVWTPDIQPRVVGHVCTRCGHWQPKGRGAA